MYTVGLLEIRGHFCKKLIGGNTDIHGEAKGISDLVLDGQGSGNRIAVGLFISGKIHITFINADLFNSGAEGYKEFHQPFAVGAVQFVVGRNQQKVRAFFQSMGHRFSGGNMVCFGRDGFGQDNAVAAGHVSADDRRDFPQVQGIAVF